LKSCWVLGYNHLRVKLRIVNLKFWIRDAPGSDAGQILQQEVQLDILDRRCSHAFPLCISSHTQTATAGAASSIHSI
jgi:hypothetical protein